MAEREPTCPMCRMAIHRGDLVRFPSGGGVVHLRCTARRPGARVPRRPADTICPACGVTMEAGDHVVKIGDDVVHAACFDGVIRRLPNTGT
jgi:hypothetical protein